MQLYGSNCNGQLNLQCVRLYHNRSILGKYLTDVTILLAIIHRYPSIFILVLKQSTSQNRNVRDLPGSPISDHGEGTSNNNVCLTDLIILNFVLFYTATRL